MKKRLLLLVLVLPLLFSIFNTTLPSIDISSKWSTNQALATELATPAKIELTPEEKDLSVRDAIGENGVVTSASPIASKVGLEILRKGGNAIDAAVATAFTLGLVEPFASGLGGGGFMLIHLAETGEDVFVDFAVTAPGAAKPNMFIGSKASISRTGTSVLVPGEVDGLLTALENYGTMSRKDVLEPVIRLAEEGFEVPPFLSQVLMDAYEELSKDAETAKLFINDILPYLEGDIFVNKDYANTLKRIMKEGRDGFYKGPVAQAIVDAVRKDGGVMTLKDLEDYETKIRKPVRGNYRGYDIVSSPPGSSGGTVVIEALHIAENFDIKSLGVNTVDSLHLWSEIFRLIQGDRLDYVVDSDFEKVPLEGLTSKEYAKQRMKLIDLEKRSPNRKGGNPWPYESPSTTHVSVLDKYGNAVSLTQTIGTYFGSYVVPKGLGFLLNNSMSNFATTLPNYVNRIQPHKRPRSTMSPTIVLKDGQPYLVVGSPGAGRIVSTVILAISNIIDHGMDVQEAINTGRIHQEREGPIDVEGNIPEEVREGLIKKGHEITVYGETDYYFGGVHAILRDPETGLMHGGADPRRDGKALAY